MVQIGKLTELQAVVCYLFIYLQYPQGREALERGVGITILLNHFAKCGGVLDGCDVTGKAIPVRNCAGEKGVLMCCGKTSRPGYLFRMI